MLTPFAELARREFALVQLTRFRPVRGVRKRTASTDSVVLHSAVFAEVRSSFEELINLPLWGRWHFEEMTEED